MDRGAQILAKANILVAIENKLSDEEIYAFSEAFGNDRLKSLIDIVIKSNLDHKIAFFSEFLVEKHPDQKATLILEAIKLSLNWDHRTQTEDLLIRYTEEFGEDLYILIEKLEYYIKYEYKKIDRIQAILEQINAMEAE